MMAEYERAQILERSRRGKRHHARQGHVNVLCGAPYGYRYMRKTPETAAYYEIIEEQAAVVRKVYDWYTAEGPSIAAIMRRLNEQGVPTRKRLSRSRQHRRRFGRAQSPRENEIRAVGGRAPKIPMLMRWDWPGCRCSVCLELCTIGAVTWAPECWTTASIAEVRVCVTNCSEVFMDKYTLRDPRTCRLPGRTRYRDTSDLTWRRRCVAALIQQINGFCIRAEVR
jgi:Recombinase